MADYDKSSTASSGSGSDKGSKKTPSEELGIQNPWVSGGENDPDAERYAHLDPTKVVGRYAEQPDPNDDIGPPVPNVPEGVNEAPADDDDDAGAIGSGDTESKAKK